MRAKQVGLALTLLVCGVSGLAVTPKLNPEPATGLERLGIGQVVVDQRLTGKGVRIAVLSEAADGEHPDFEGADLRQWRFVQGGSPTTAERAEPLLVSSDWHGTHIASVLAARCNLPNRGVACGASLDVHDFGVYGDFIPLDWDASVGEVEADFLNRVIRGFDHAAQQGADIANLSFNLETPALALKSPNKPEVTVKDRLDKLGVGPGAFFRRRAELRESGAIAFERPESWSYLTRIGAHHDNPSSLMIGFLLPVTLEWQRMAEAMARFQASGGVIVIAESNNRFEGHSGLLNTMPSQYEGVRESQWLSIVHVRADAAGGFETPLNGCGREAAQYCMAVYSPNIEAAAPEGQRHTASGHSMAVPMVTGLLALMLEKGGRVDPGLSVSEALCVLRASAVRDFPGYDPSVHGLGVLQPLKALESIVPDAQGGASQSCDI